MGVANILEERRVRVIGEYDISAFGSVYGAFLKTAVDKIRAKYECEDVECKPLVGCSGRLAGWDGRKLGEQ